MKISVIVTVFCLIALFFSLFVLSSTVVLAASDDFIANGDITTGSVAGNGVTATLIIRSGSRASSWAYNGSNTTLQVTNSDSSNRFRVGSDDANVISMRVNNNNGNEIACVDGNAGVEVPAGSVDAYSVYPSSASCSGTAVRGTSGSSGGGGGAPATPATPAVPGINPAVPASPALTNASFRAFFNRRLVVGSIGNDVKGLQQFLNGQGFMVSKIGPGAPGSETTYFGRATQAALLKFQLANGIIQSQSDPGAGTVGPKTRAKINSMGSAGVSAPATAPADLQAKIQSLRAQLQSLIELVNRLKAQQ